MPRIDAATVAEHRARQHEALLAAAEELLLDEGFDALTFAALGERTGLARNSVYRYFSSREDMLAQVLERPLPAWLERVAGALDAAEGLPDQIAAFVTVQLRLVAAVRPELGKAMAQAPLGPELRARISAMNYQPAALLERVLERHGDPSASVTAQLVQGIVNAAVRVLHQAEVPLEELIATATTTARRSVGCGEDRPPAPERESFRSTGETG